MKKAIVHLQRFGINVDDTWPEPNADGSYPNSDDDNADTEKPDAMDEMITDQDIDADTVSGQSKPASDGRN